MADWHLAQIINQAFGWTVVTPWTVGRLPEADVQELLYWFDVVGKRSRIEEERRKREAGVGD
jgi:hypothetical protein